MIDCSSCGCEIENIKKASLPVRGLIFCEKCTEETYSKSTVPYYPSFIMEQDTKEGDMVCVNPKTGKLIKVENLKLITEK